MPGGRLDNQDPASDPVREEHLDPEIYDALAQSIGADMMDELLSKVGEDLARQRKVIADAADAGDETAMRGATHVMIAVAGAIGATPLQRQAEKINALANESRMTEIAPLADALLTETGQVLQLIGHR